MRTRAELSATLRTDQRFWRDLAAEVGPNRWAEPGPMGEWSFGDLAGHLLGWRERTIGRIEGFVRGDADPPPPWPADLDDDDGQRLDPCAPRRPRARGAGGGVRRIL